MTMLHRWQYLASGALLFLAGELIAPLPAAAAPSVTLGAIKFYSAKHFVSSSCAARGKAAKSFRTTVSAVYAQVTYSSWHGSHVQQSKWLAPDGSVYATSRANSFVGHGGLVSCLPLPIAGEPAAQLPGRWTYQVLVDHQQVGQAYLKLKAVSLL